MRRRLLAVAALIALSLGLWPVSAQAAQPEPPLRHVAVFVVDGMSFEQFMRVPEFRALARAGGAGLMSFRVPRGDEGPGAVLTFGTGARSAVPFGKVTFTVSGRPEEGVRLHVNDFDVIVEENEHRSEPGLLGSVLAQHGIRSCADGRTVLVTVDRAGDARAMPSPGGTPVRGYRPMPCSVQAVSLVHLAPREAGRQLRAIVEASYRGAVRVIVAEARASPEMLITDDELAPIAMADGTPDALFSGRGPMHTLSSDSTRRDGVLSNEDVAPTILAAFNIPVPSEMNGARIGFVDDAPPFDLHRRHLEQRRIRVPIDVVVGIAVFLFGMLGVVLVARKRSLSPRLRVGVAGIVLAMAGLGVSPLAAGGLPILSYTWVAPFVVLVPVAAGLLAMLLRARGTLAPPVAIGSAILLFFVVESARGWPDTLTTFFGGTALDGARFYGLPNVEIGVILGAALWVATVLPTAAGFALLFACGLFAGLPNLGVNFGAALTLFAVAGMWLAVRTRVGWVRAILVVAGATVVGMGIVVGANLLWSQAPTHGARFVHNAPNRGWSGLLEFAKQRILVGWRLMIHAPLTWVPVLGLVPLLYLLVRPTPALEAGFRRYPAWRDAVLVTILGSMVAYVANDSGPAAAGWGFGLAVAAILYVPLLEETWRTRTSRSG